VVFSTLRSRLHKGALKCILFPRWGYKKIKNNVCENTSPKYTEQKTLQIGVRVCLYDFLLRYVYTVLARKKKVSENDSRQNNSKQVCVKHFKNGKGDSSFDFTGQTSKVTGAL